jgi:hypothetical protein
MQDSIDLHEDLAKRIGADFLNNKLIINKDEVVYALKQILKQYSITDIDFLTLKDLVKCMCILKKIDYQKIYVESKLAELYEFKGMIFKKTREHYFTASFNKIVAHNSILKTFDIMCKNLTKDNDTFELRVETLKTGGYCYFIKKNKKDAYVIFYPSMYEGEIYLRRFMSLEYDLNKLPETIKGGRRLVNKHKYKYQTPYFNGFFLNEIEMAISLIEDCNNEK